MFFCFKIVAYQFSVDQLIINWLTNHSFQLHFQDFLKESLWAPQTKPRSEKSHFNATFLI